MTLFAFLMGAVFLALGVLGMVPLFLVPPPVDAPTLGFTFLYGYLFGVFPVNVLLSGLHVGLGLWGISAVATNAGRAYARWLAFICAALAIIGAFPATLFSVVPIHGNDVWLYAVAGVLAIWAGWRRAQSHDRRAVLDRRQRIAPVNDDRRSRHPDRRRGYGMYPA